MPFAMPTLTATFKYTADMLGHIALNFHKPNTWIFFWGKTRRTFICMIPGLADKLRKKHAITGGCKGCGTSCNLLIQCPSWDPATKLCTIYESRPAICRHFPITPADIKERNLANPDLNCGFEFKG